MNRSIRSILSKNTAKPDKALGVTSESLGQRVRQLRSQSGLTQTELASRSGVSHSALSKIENSQLSPTFETLLRIAAGLAIDISELLASSNLALQRTRRVITRHGQGERYEAENYVYETLCDEITNKRMIPMVARIKSHSVEEFGPLVRHSGEEMLYVLEGEVKLHTDHYAPVHLKPGDCAYFDSSMGHACISATETDAIVFWVSTPS